MIFQMPSRTEQETFDYWCAASRCRSKDRSNPALYQRALHRLDDLCHKAKSDLISQRSADVLNEYDAEVEAFMQSNIKSYDVRQGKVIEIMNPGAIYANANTGRYSTPMKEALQAVLNHGGGNEAV